MIFEREIKVFFASGRKKRLDIYMHTGWGKSSFHNTECFQPFFFHDFFQSIEESEEEKTG